MTDEERKQFINEYCRNVGNIKIKCDDCKFVEDCVDYGWDGCKKFTPTQKKRHTQETTELKRCPFCGNEPTIVIRKGKDGWRDRYSVLCDYEHGGCGAESGWYHYEVEAVESWNRRVPPTNKEIEEYVEKIHKENMELIAKIKRKYEVAE